MTLESAKAFDGFEDGGRGPSQHHLAPTPAFHIPLHVTRATQEAFDRIRGGERVTEPLGNPEAEHRERFVESFAHALGRAGMLGLQPPREIQ